MSNNSMSQKSNISNGARHILIVAGEASGDLHASNLVKAMQDTGCKMQDTGLRFSGLGGEKMQEAGVELLEPFTKNAGTGLDPLLKITHFSQVFRKLVSYASKTKPDLAILVDFPDFNLRLAPRLKALGIKVVYYISPQIWAWRQSRVKIVQKYVDKMIVIFGFEKEFYSRFNVPAEFVGHPLLDALGDKISADASHDALSTSKNLARKSLGLDPKDLVIGLLPGSRPSEFKRHFPIMQEAITKISHRGTGNIKYILGAAPDITPTIINRITKKDTPEIISYYNRTHEILAASDILITVSGTITVEAALFQTPMVVIYKVPLLTELVFRPLVKTPFYAMVNIIAGKKVVPELIQQNCTPGKIAEQAINLLDKDARNRMRHELGQVKAKLGAPGASQRAAEIISKILTTNINNSKREYE